MTYRKKELSNAMVDREMEHTHAELFRERFGREYINPAMRPN